MGWEWHNRYRRDDGRFDRDPERRKREQLNLKIDPETAAVLKIKAKKAKMEIGEYARKVFEEYWKSKPI